jgi:hypothetical protein
MSPTLLQSIEVALQTSNTQALDEISRLASQTSINETLDHSVDGICIMLLFERANKCRYLGRYTV